jgi:glycosyltransferase involved in cell wall biosynthesis
VKRLVNRQIRILKEVFRFLWHGSRNDELGGARSLFDSDFYRGTYSDISFAEVGPFEHYISWGWRDGRNPSATFDTAYYLKTYPDVRAAGVCPLVHYATHGAQEGRVPSPPPPYPYAPLERARDYFDSDYYLKTYSDIADAGVDPFRHYAETGWREGRDPSATFSTRFYLNTNTDVRDLEICPLIHYVTEGEREGRLAQGPVDYGRWAIDNAMPARERATYWPRLVEEDPVSKAELLETLLGLVPAARRGLVVALSHDDYVKIYGGVQNAVGDEEVAFSAAGFAYLHLSPALPLPSLANGGDDFLVSLRLDGRRLGIASVADICAALERAAPGKIGYVIVHQLLGFQLQAVEKLVVSFAPRKTIFWVHDFFHLCVNPYLLRNDVTFCAAPPVDSNACAICVYGEERIDFLRQMKRLFDVVRPILIAPSESALNFWRDRGGFSVRECHVVPLGWMEFDAPELSLVNFPLRIAFLGTPVYHKGWGVFEALAAAHAGDSRYKFFFCGTNPPNELRNITHVPVRVTKVDREAMCNALMAHHIDVALLWSLWPETFCFTAHEAMAAGVFVVTRRAAGNIWPAVSCADIEAGIGLETEAELREIFATGQILSLIGNKRFGHFHVQPATVAHLLGS